MTIATQGQDETRSEEALATPRTGLVGLIGLISPLVALFLLMLLLTSVASNPLDNADTWFHLRLGHEFLGPWSLSRPGALTTFATSDWVPTQWSTEMLAAKFEDLFGLPGVAWLFGAFYLAFVVTVYLGARQRGGRGSAVAVATLVVFASASTLSARPQVVSLILLSLTMTAWSQTGQDLRPRWWLVPMTWLWATAHGMWSAGVLLAGVFWLGLVLDGRVRGKHALRLLAVPALSLGAALLTPVGPTLVTSQFVVSARSSMIAEWGPTSFRSVPAMAAALMVAALVVIWARRGRVSWTALLLLLLAGGWIALVSRMVPLGAVVLAPLLAEALHGLRRDHPSRHHTPRGERAAVLGALFVCLVGLAVAVPRTAAQPSGVPSGFSSRLEALPAGSPILVEDGTGGWIEWRFPKLDPVIDGMLDAYPVSYMKRFQEYRKLAPRWRSFVSDSHADVAVLKTGSPLSAAMRSELHWRQVQRDGEWVYLVAPGSAS